MKLNNENIQVKPSKKKGEKKVTVVLENDLTIYSVDELKKIIDDLYKKYDDLNFEFKNIKNIDLTFVQLLFSIKQSALNDDKKITLDVDMPEDLELLFNNADIKRVFKV